MNLIAAIQSFVPGCAQEAADQDLILSLALREPIAVLTRESLAAHMTASGFIVNEARNKTLMVHHNIYNSWSWTGGHADGDSDLLAVALREAREETGIVNVAPLSREIMSLDVLTVPGHVKNGVYVSAHLHLSAAYLLIASEKQTISAQPDENSGVQWIAFGSLERMCNEAHMLPVYRKLIERMQKLV
ncbi:NUDIX hydrolase [Anaerotruncus colihominis]|uniref:NUDIX hydrolase n=1 Tax=Anaerotruncus colihominis TaxID=169435 RepID=UPI00242C1D04|nr:NUDIX hydrolase [Anaerotruncus colihominis]